MRKHIPVFFASALTALLVSIAVQIAPVADATLLADQASYRYTLAGHNPFTSGGALTHTDLNANFQALVNVIDGNIDETNIASSVEALWPRAWAAMKTICTTGTCALADSQGITSVTWNSAGDYNVNLTTARPSANFAAIATAGLSVADLVCQAETTTTSVVVVRCLVTTTGTETNGDFSVLILDTQ